jgi:hypothetical protein
MSNLMPFKAELAVLLQKYFPELKGFGPQRISLDVHMSEATIDISDPRFERLPDPGTDPR